ncbi:CDP-glycerol glycerophosphotransferase family protein [Lentisphaera profundi]|uniref:CDP-glycerol glycerophosphotransferase family protein n=1 Tax=Lentisphaera profundi TaxID=1658616 RepID=A0ABY7W0P4_9BACT|nr:CDP-glycerol glycerophosphotransferase family protein [Lentisphaera profundi]WDE99119.1 CDP-glycerol glycerophosphotransferase family protein [Lentisphaera profundi]
MIGGVGAKTYCDNSCTFFEYLMNETGQKAYYVLSKHSKDLEKVRKLGPVLYKDSIKANYFSLSAKALVFSSGLKGDIVRINEKYLSRAVKVNLQHGVFGLKNNTIKYEADFSVTCGEEEAKLKAPLLGKGQELILTGFPQHDKLITESIKITPDKKTIFYMPTWREWFVGKDSFKESDFYANFTSFLTNPRLLAFLRENGIKINCYLHRNNMKYYSDLPDDLFNENICLLPENTNIQQQILISSLLITDYSSVSWEFLLLKKGVIFYQFDQSEYLKQRGSLLDFDKGIFGPICKSADECIDLLMESTESGYDKLLDLSWRDKFFTHYDGKNCERIYKKILIELARCKK